MVGMLCTREFEYVSDLGMSELSDEVRFLGELFASTGGLSARPEKIS